MRTVLGIDPGNTESGWVLIDIETCKPIRFGKADNGLLRDAIKGDCPGDQAIHADLCAIEMVASYGMPVGKEVFETCVWIGRFQECLMWGWMDPQLVFRNQIKIHHCNSSKAKDSNITQALVDRFAPGQRNYGKGTKAEPGWFYGFKADIWAAYALAVYVADIKAGRS